MKTIPGVMTVRDLAQSATKKLAGPWPCEQCHNLTQFAEQTLTMTRVFCANEKCGYKRVVDRRNGIIIEPDGTVWSYDPRIGTKTRVRGR